MNDKNEIVDEIRSIRESILAEYGGDVHALIHEMDKQTGELAKTGRTVVTRGPRPIQPRPTPARKVG